MFLSSFSVQVRKASQKVRYHLLWNTFVPPSKSMGTFEDTEFKKESR
jgi:hypothetical protein